MSQSKDTCCREDLGLLLEPLRLCILTIDYKLRKDGKNHVQHVYPPKVNYVYSDCAKLSPLIR